MNPASVLSYMISVDEGGTSVDCGISVGAIGVEDGATAVAVALGRFVGICVFTDVGVEVGVLIKATGVDVMVRDAVDDPTGMVVAVIEAVLDVLVVTLYSICNKGALAELVSYACATRLPLPEKIITIELPLVQPD